MASRGLRLVGALAVIGCPHNPAWCQAAPPRSMLWGVVRSDSSGAPLSGVEVLLPGTPFRAETNLEGRYRIEGLDGGTYQVVFRRVGYLPVRMDVMLRPPDTTRANITLIPSAVELEPIVVSGVASRQSGVGIGREAFDERRRLGFGRYFDSTILRAFESNTLYSLLRRDSGLEIRQLWWDRIQIWVAMHPTRRNVRGEHDCLVQVYMDGQMLNRGGVLGTSDVLPIDLRTIGVNDLEAVEVYRSAAEVPQEYGGPNAGCGVILLWSRRGP